MGRSMASSDVSSSTKKLSFFVSLANTATGLDPAGRLESLAYLLTRAHGTPRYDFHLKGGKPASWSFLTDLMSVRWQPDFAVIDPIDRISALQVKSGPADDDAITSALQRLLAGSDARRLDQIAGLVFVYDLLSSTGRSAADDEVVEKYWQLVPPKNRPPKEDLPLDAAREVFALAA